LSEWPPFNLEAHAVAAPTAQHGQLASPAGHHACSSLPALLQFGRIAEGGGKYLLECSFLEIYNEVRTCWPVDA